jgi:hypothetical protein
MSKIDPTTEDYFQTLDKKGGPTDTITGLEEIIRGMYAEKTPEKYPDPKQYPLFKYLDGSKKNEEIFDGENGVPEGETNGGEA